MNRKVLLFSCLLLLLGIAQSTSYANTIDVTAVRLNIFDYVTSQKVWDKDASIHWNN